MSDQSGGYPGAPPGWYPDPAGGPGQRWWDGYAWSEAVATPTAAPQPPPWAVASARLSLAATTQAVTAENGMIGLAALAVAIPGLHYIVDFVIEQAQSAQFLDIGNHFRAMWQAAQNNQPLPSFTETTSLSWLSGLFVLLTLVAVVIACIWQHRAASAARALGLPARHSPGWGVGSWFVPVVNLFVPYQAIRDCLPPGDPTRKLVLAWWLILMGAWSTALASQLAAYFSRPVGIGFGIPSLLFSLGLFATAPRLVQEIAARHRSLLAQAQGAPVGV